MIFSRKVAVLKLPQFQGEIRPVTNSEWVYCSLIPGDKGEEIKLFGMCKFKYLVFLIKIF